MMSHSHSHTSWVLTLLHPLPPPLFTPVSIPGACQEIPGECHHPGVTPFKLHAPATPWEGFFCISPLSTLDCLPNGLCICQTSQVPLHMAAIRCEVRFRFTTHNETLAFALGGDMLTSLLQGSQHRSNFRPIHRPAANLSKLLIDSLFHTRHPLRTARFKQPMLVSCESGWAEARFMFCLQVVLRVTKPRTNPKALVRVPPCLSR
jgi:hypothetical protein